MDVPIEVLIHIYKYLPHSDRLSCTETCKLWFEAGCDRTFRNRECVYYVKNTLQDDISPCNIYGTHSHRVFANFAFREMDMSSMRRFWHENGENVKCLEFDTCDMQEKVFVNILNQCPNIESLVVSNCKELFMSARVLEDLRDASLKNLKILDLSMNRYLTDAMFYKFASTAVNLNEVNLSECPISFHPGLYKKFYPFGLKEDGSQSPSESVLTFHYIFKYFETNAHLITKISMNKTLIDGSALKSISELPQLKLTHLYVNECDQLNYDGLIAVTQFQTNLVELDIGKCSRVTDKSLVAICANLVKLKSLCINRCRAITNVGVSDLWNLKTLENVDISQCELITDEGIKNGVCRDVNPTLRSLNLSCMNMEESTVALLAEKLPNLTSLNLNFCFTSVTDKSIQVVFKHLTNLHSLSISHCEQVTDAGLTGMGMGKEDYVYTESEPAKLKAPLADSFHKISLRSRAEEEIVRDARKKHGVRLMCENLTSNGSEGYSMIRLTNLRNLDMSGCNRITDVSLTYAFNFRQLKSINLSECQQITHEGLEQLSCSCPSIETIQLVDCYNIRDEGVKILVKNLKRLKHLHLRGCNLLTDHSLLAIRDYGKILKLLDVQGCRNISPELAQDLSCITTLHTILFSKPGPYITDGLKQRHPVPPPLPSFSKFRRFF